MINFKNPNACTACNGDSDYIGQCEECNGTGSLKYQRMIETGIRPRVQAPEPERLPRAPARGPLSGKVTQILLDLDDVLVECSGEIMRHMGLTNYNVWEDYPEDIGRDIIMAYELATNVRYSAEVFWEHFKREFWAGLPKTPWCDELIDCALMAVGYGNVYICTSPTKCGECLAGKLDWIDANMPWAMARDYIMTPRKEACAFAGSVLIDDAEVNVDKFNAAGGTGVLLPAPWNKNRHLMNDQFGFIEDLFDNWCG